LRATSELRFRLKIDSVAEKKIGCRPRIGGNRRWRYLRLELKAKTAVGSRRRRQRHDEGYHGSRFGAPAPRLAVLALDRRQEALERGAVRRVAGQNLVGERQPLGR